ncbi:TonB-dependent receptor plug domain-containing protein [Pseudoxanthomonas winnipegensis]|uniref:TonB-dependent receptor plug domain-containing protein n=1 Tax=Pseudoxanthomonas winnipegensis TaxID=2480810 RepID=UPI003F87302F
MLFWIAIALSGAVGAQEVTRKTASDKQPIDSGQDDTSTQSAVQLDTVQVTGTRIKGGTTPSPVITIDSTRIREEGFTDLGEVIRSVPQNFSGGQNPGVSTSANVSGNNINTTGGSSLNLRGLGQDATLTLLNGRRMSYGGWAQGVDISAIPVEAVERLEIVPDGASAVYGADAVGGVANVILKPDFDGVTLGTRFGGATDGGLAMREYTATAGTTWDGGGLLATFRKASSDPIDASQRAYTRRMYQPATLWPGSDARSGLVSLHQALGDALELHLDALRTERHMSMKTGYATSYYLDTPETNTTLVSPGLDLALPGDWTLTASAAQGRDKTYTHRQVIRTQTGVVSSDSLGTYSNQSATYELGVEGPVLTLPAGQARLAAGAGYRAVDFLSLGITSNRTAADGDERSRFAYVELNLPLVAPEQQRRGVERFSLTGALRNEDYDDYGRVTTPKLGLIYAPGSDFTLRASWGKSFKAPRLLQRYTNQDIALYPAATLGGDGQATGATVLYRAGGNADLRPERARTWSAALAFHPEGLPGLEAELSWFDIDYTGRIVQPVVATQALRNPDYAAFVTTDPTQAEMAQAIADSVRFLNYTSGGYDPTQVVAIVDNRSVNAAAQHIEGVDLSGAYRFDVGQGRLALRGAASWLDSTQATLPTQDAYDLAGTLYYPARVSARVGAVWRQGGLMASLFGNYKSGVRNTTRDEKGASFTTFDATLRYELAAGLGMLSDVAIELAAQNLFNRAPPLYTVTTLNEAPFDSTNYSAVGRFVSLSVSKHW